MVFVGGCSRSSGVPRAQPTPMAKVALEAAAPPIDAGSIADSGGQPAKLVPGAGRVFFGKWTTQNPAIAVEELYVVRDEDAGVRAFFSRDQDDWAASLDGAGHLRPSTTGPEPLEVTLYEDGTFEGEHQYTDGSKSIWVRAPFAPVEIRQLAQPAGFVGDLSRIVRYRIKLALRGDAVEGVARYPTTRSELRIAGKIDRGTRNVTADELDRDGHVTGHIDAILLGHVVPATFSERLAIIGHWSSPDGKRRLPMRLEEGYYPDRVTMALGRSLSAQEVYTRDCDLVNEYVYPVIDGAPKGFAESVGASLKSIAFDYEDPDGGVIRMAPGARIKRDACPVDPERRGTNSTVYTATALFGSWVALQFEHYAQEGSISGHVWSECIAVDLATGELLEAAKLLDPATRATLTERARSEALASLPPVDAGSKDEPEDGMRVAAAELSLEDVPLCIEEHTVRFALISHRVFGPAQPVFDRGLVARLLAPGKLRDLVAPAAR
jgi:hypothetical protein